MATKKKTVGTGRKSATQKASKAEKHNHVKKTTAKVVLSAVKSSAKKKTAAKSSRTGAQAEAGKKTTLHSNKIRGTNVKKTIVKKNIEVTANKEAKKKATKAKVVERKEVSLKASPKSKGKTEEKTKKTAHEVKPVNHKKVPAEAPVIISKENHTPVSRSFPKRMPLTVKSSGKPKFIYKPEPSILDTTTEESQGPRKRYSDNELQEFKDLIQRKLEAAKKELTYLQGLITRKDEAGTDDTENKYMGVEDGSGTMEREQLSQMASRQIQFIDHLEKALVRIENKTYGICRVTGKLIDKARLRAVPHATLSIEAKLANKR